MKLLEQLERCHLGHVHGYGGLSVSGAFGVVGLVDTRPSTNKDGSQKQLCILFKRFFLNYFFCFTLYVP